MEKDARREETPADLNVPFTFRYREFVPFEPENANGTPTERSTGTAGREDDYDTP